MYAIVKDFDKGPLTHDVVFDNLKNGGQKLMCYDSQYEWMPDGKIERIHVGRNNEIIKEILDFNYPTVWTMFNNTNGKYAKELPYGPWYFGYITEINS